MHYYLPTWNLHPTMLCIKDAVATDLLPETSSHPSVYCLPGHVQVSVTSLFSFPGGQHRCLGKPSCSLREIPLFSLELTVYLQEECWHLHDPRIVEHTILFLKFFWTYLNLFQSTTPSQFAWVNLVAKKKYLQLSQIWSQCGALYAESCALTLVPSFAK